MTFLSVRPAQRDTLRDLPITPRISVEKGDFLTQKINRNRSHQLAVRLSDSELALFNKKQAASGLNKTDFLVKLLKGSKVTAYHFTDDVKQLCGELRKIGVNLNQIAYLVNIGRHTEAEGEILRMRTAYFNIFDKVSAFLDKPSVHIKESD